MMIWIILVLYIAYSGIKIYAAMAEMGYILEAKKWKPVILSAQNYEKAAAYKIAVQKFTI
ncbi:MAG: hypothetical protein LRY68_10940 [Sulfurospirillum sp.]|nr:hypothetical protein [Sulfurospirillum sp.]